MISEFGSPALEIRNLQTTEFWFDIGSALIWNDSNEAIGPYRLRADSKSQRKQIKSATDV